MKKNKRSSRSRSPQDHDRRRSKDRKRSRHKEKRTDQRSPGLPASSSKKHKRRSRSSSPYRSRKPEEEISLKSYSRFLDRMFFRDSDVISKGTTQYSDFWNFYGKIMARKQKSCASHDSIISKDVREERVDVGGVTVPKKFHKKYTLPFRLKQSNIDDYISNLYPEDQEFVRKKIPKAKLEEFMHCLLYYLDFLQKERFKKLKSLRESQANLPIAAFRDKIISTLNKHNVLIIAGDTGCGKSTQVPQYLLQAGYTKIACTQPRRIACISLSKRVAYETLNEYGSAVGYQIRFEKKKTTHTKLLFLTEGLLLRQVSADPMLENYNVILLDEVHERHLHTDFLLGILKCLVYQRENVKVILMSATINTELFQDYFNGLAPILTVPGRLYPITVQFRPISVEELNTRNGKINPAPYIRILQLIDEKYPAEERGDVLMFLSGTTEISIVLEAAKFYAETSNRWIILPLHSMLSVDDQDKAFDYPPEGVRKCIIATNIAETSITIDGVRFVIDSGKVKEMTYDAVCKMQRLKEFWTSRASVEQRKGRAGRTGPGVCYRMFSQQELEEMDQYSTPEIRRVPLDTLLLQMIAIGIPDCRKFPFIEPPPINNIESSLARLKEQDALTEEEALTATGKTLSQLPVDVTIGKMLIMGTLFDQIETVLSLAAALSVQSPYTSYAHRDPDCSSARKSLDSEFGDPLSLLNAYRAWLEEKAEEYSKSKAWCRKRGFEEQRFYEMTKLRQQFKSLLEDAGLLKGSHEGMSLMSSAERSIRHGELKQLRSLKKEFHMSAPRKKRILKVDSFDDVNEEDKDDSLDIKDIDFRLRNDSSQVRNLLHKSTAHGHEDVSMIKLILVSGFYPQLAIPDDFNKYKSDVDQMFHTREKGFTVLHPTSIFANNPEWLKMKESDVLSVPNHSNVNPKLILSPKHQLLCYMTLLETNKAYLMNTLRMPCLQTLMLFSHSIDTDSFFSRLVFDSWIEVELLDSSAARLIIATVIQLRDAWNCLLTNRLQSESKAGIVGEEKISDEDIKKARNLTSDLVDFLRLETPYTIRRLLAADQKDLYDLNSTNLENLDLDEEGYVGNMCLEKDFAIDRNIKKGGISLTSYLTYSCLYSEIPETSKMDCPFCDKEIGELPLNLFLHLFICRKDKQTEMEAEDEAESLKARKFAKVFFCEVCDKQLHLTPIEILRHKRSHNKDKC